MRLVEMPFFPYLEKGQQILKEYELACTWLDSLGIPHKRGRFGRYQKELATFERRIKSDLSTHDKISAFYSYINSYIEATELIRIKDALVIAESTTYLSQLKKATSGQLFRNVVNNDPSRNFFFELTLAARLLNAGYSVVVNELADAEAYIDGSKVFFECKRVTSQKAVKSRVKEANKQLRTRLENAKSQGSKGIVGLNVTELLNPRLVMVVGNDIHELKDYHSTLLTGFVNSHINEITCSMGKDILGVMCEFNMYGYIQNKTPLTIVNCRGAKFVQYNITKEEEKFVYKLVMKISNQRLVRKC